MGCVRSARALLLFYSLAGERFPGVRAIMRRRQDLGWTFRLGTRWASGVRAEGAGRRAGTHMGTHPRLRQQGPEPARRGGAEARGRAGVWGSRLRGDRSASARCDDFRRRLSSGPLPLRCVASVHARFVPFCSTDFLRCGGVGSLSETLFVPHYVLLRGPRCLSRFVCVLSNNNNNNDRRATPTNPTKIISNLEILHDHDCL